MISFKQLTLSDIPLLRPYLAAAPGDACDNTVGGTFMWRDYFNTYYAIVEDSLIVRADYFGRTAFTLPIGGDVERGIGIITQHCRELGIPAVFCTATREDLASLGGRPIAELKPEPDWYDYLYDRAELAALSGKKFHGQRNHVSYFDKCFPDSLFRLASGAVVDDIAGYFDRYAAAHSKDSPYFDEEQAKVAEVLRNFDAYGMTGGALYAGGRLVAFSLGERKRDTFFIHIEKAEDDLRGCHQRIVTELARNLPDSILYLNREEDVGDPGLRTSKMSWHPCRIIEKFTVQLADI